MGKTYLWRSWDIFMGMLKAKTNREVPEIADLRAHPFSKFWSCQKDETSHLRWTSKVSAFSLSEHFYRFWSVTERRPEEAVITGLAQVLKGKRTTEAPENQPQVLSHTLNCWIKLLRTGTPPRYSTILLLTVDSQQYDQFRVPLKLNPNMVIVLV